MPEARLLSPFGTAAAWQALLSAKEEVISEEILETWDKGLVFPLIPRLYICQSQARNPLDVADSEGNCESCVFSVIQPVVDTGHFPAHLHVAPGALHHAG